MLVPEAQWTSEILGRFSREELSPLLNIGSSTLDYRTRTKPYIESMIFGPLAKAGVTIVHADLKSGPGIDVTADLLEEEGFARLRAVEPTFVLCGNVLEHVTDPATFANRCLELVPPGGRVLFTVPRSYPHHRDPFDTMFRPAPREVLGLLHRPVEVETMCVIETGSYRDNLRKRPWIITRQIFRLPVPFLGWTKWKRSMAKFYWMVRPYRLSCLLVRVPGDDVANSAVSAAGTRVSAARITEAAE